MNQGIKNWGRLILLAIIWGSSFLLMKRGMTHKPTGEAIFDNNQVAALRMLIAALVLIPFALPKITVLFQRKNILPLLIVGFFGNFIPAFLFTYAETMISSGLAGMLNSCTPIFTVLIGYFLFKQLLIRLQVIGIVIGTLGIIALVGSGASLTGASNFWAIAAVIGATVGYASSLNTIKHKLGHLPPLTITSLGFIATLPVSLFLIVQLDVTTSISERPHLFYGLSHIAVLAIIGTAISVIIFNRLIADTSAVFASSVTYFIPIVAAIIGLLDGETLTIQQFGGMLLILIGVYVINVIGRKKKLSLSE